jgi:hypothetical protein
LAPADAASECPDRNVEPALHAHVVPRHASDDPDLRKKAVWLHDWTRATAFDPARHRKPVGLLATRLE